MGRSGGARQGHVAGAGGQGEAGSYSSLQPEQCRAEAAEDKQWSRGGGRWCWCQASAFSCTNRPREKGGTGHRALESCAWQCVLARSRTYVLVCVRGRATLEAPCSPCPSSAFARRHSASFRRRIHPCKPMRSARASSAQLSAELSRGQASLDLWPLPRCAPSRQS